jgi:hypothetical protein
MRDSLLDQYIERMKALGYDGTTRRYHLSVLNQLPGGSWEWYMSREFQGRQS